MSGHALLRLALCALMCLSQGCADNSVETLAPEDPDLPLRRSGDASSIVLLALQTSSIFVAGSGGNETGDLIFEVRDVDGTPVDLDHQVKVRFVIMGGPGGGEFLSPDSALTDSNGQVVTTVNSGREAGALQIVAEIAGTSIVSGPIPVAIHGWLPDIAHFSLASSKLNFAGYNIFGLENRTTAFVGDRFSNPVPPGTIVHFNSTGGLIGGSAVTDSLGRASVSLLSAFPLPQGVPREQLRRIAAESLPSYFFEPGFALVTAETVDENEETIYAEHVVLFSGLTQISVTPTTFTIPAFGFQVFNYIVSDQNDNPLVEGTAITVETNEGDVAGDTDVVLSDTQSRLATQFSFVLTNSNADSSLAKSATVTIKVRSQNGNLRRSITGQMLSIQ